MKDEQAPPIGTKGTAMNVDDIGSIGVNWDNGSSLSVAFGADCCRTLVPEFTQTVRNELLAIRESGESNMLDLPTVQCLAPLREHFLVIKFLTYNALLV